MSKTGVLNANKQTKTYNNNIAFCPKQVGVGKQTKT
jgi:hypothetical protein